jgi:hypothetical protein
VIRKHKHRHDAGEIGEEEYRELNKHLNAELERLTRLYRGQSWPVAESELYDWDR